MCPISTNDIALTAQTYGEDKNKQHNAVFVFVVDIVLRCFRAVVSKQPDSDSAVAAWIAGQRFLCSLQ